MARVADGSLVVLTFAESLEFSRGLPPCDVALWPLIGAPPPLALLEVTCVKLSVVEAAGALTFRGLLISQSRSGLPRRKYRLKYSLGFLFFRSLARMELSERPTFLWKPYMLSCRTKEA